MEALHEDVKEYAVGGHIEGLREEADGEQDVVGRCAEKEEDADHYDQRAFLPANRGRYRRRQDIEPDGEEKVLVPVEEALIDHRRRQQH